MPLIERSLTISGGAVEKPCNLRVPVGTLISDLEEVVVKEISGGPMMGFAMASSNFPVAKGTSGVTFLTDDEATIREENQCISCGRCVSTCAMHISPVLIVRELKAGNLNKAKRFGFLRFFC